MIAASVSDQDIVAYADGDVPHPCALCSSWHVLGPSGSFVIDIGMEIENGIALSWDEAFLFLSVTLEVFYALIMLSSQAHRQCCSPHDRVLLQSSTIIHWFLFCVVCNDYSS